MGMLKLATDSLVVQTFATAEDSRAGGTVDELETVATTGGPYLCPADCAPDTVAVSCGHTCEPIADSCASPPFC
jgi:hypothetical protein